MTLASAGTDSIALIPDLKDRVVLITGASTGIGAAAARAFGRSGARVAINFRSSQSEAEGVAEAVRQHGGQAVLVQADVTEPDAANRVVRRTVEAFGRLDALINNAGALIRRTPIAEYTEDYVDALLDLNVKPVVRFTREAVVVMQAQGTGGSIVNLSSIAARHGGGPGSALRGHQRVRGDRDARLGQGARQGSHSRQCRITGRHHDAVPRAILDRRAACSDAGHNPDGAPRARGGMCRSLPVSRLRSDERVCDGPNHRGERRAVHAVTLVFGRVRRDDEVPRMATSRLPMRRAPGRARRKSRERLSKPPM